MRVWIIGLAALALAACDSGTAPASEESNANAAGTSAEAERQGVVLRGTGLTAGSESFYFNAGQSEVERALATALGTPGEPMQMDECGPGAAVGSTYPGGLILTYFDGKLAGWFLREEGDAISLDGGPAIGASRDDVLALDGYAMVEDSPFGDEFYSESAGIGGYLDDGDAVGEIYSGMQCFSK